MEKKIHPRTFMSNGNRWYRWLFGILAVFAFLLFANALVMLWSGLALALCLLFYYLLLNSRRLEYDQKYIYMIWGKKEKTIANTSINRIERRTSALEASRIWTIYYTDENGQAKKMRTRQKHLWHNMDKFVLYVHRVNPDMELDAPIGT